MSTVPINRSTMLKMQPIDLRKRNDITLNSLYQVINEKDLDN